jgi:hypothetical protein
MAITANNGGAANSNNAAVGSLAASSFTATASAKTRVVVVLLDNTISVSSISTNGRGTYSLVAAYNISATLRIELWESTNESSGAGRIVTANFSASVVAAIAVQQWSGEIGVESGNPTDTLTNRSVQGRFTTLYDGDFAVSYMGFNGQAGDTITAVQGNLRRSSIGASGGAGVAIVDSGVTPAGANYLQEIRLNNAREWGSISQGLQASSAADTFEDYQGVLPLGPEDAVVLNAEMPLGGGGGILPPSGDGQIFPPMIRQGG